MAVLDRARNVIVLRIVYDGPGEAGKTTTLRALGERLGRPCVTPKQTGERTLYFDWFDYTGGLFEGYQLRCQVVSVPGQATLARRRAYLLGTADSIVYVTPATESGIEGLFEALHDIAKTSAAPRGIVLQANKRDLPGAVPIAVLRRGLLEAGLHTAVVESTATLGDGVREAFVFAVRLALDFVREQLRDGTLREGEPEVEGPDDLLAGMQAFEREGLTVRESTAPTLAEAVDLAPGAREKNLPPPENGGFADAVAEALGPSVEGSGTDVGGGSEASTGPPRLPDTSVPSGLIWPPIDGRLGLADATAFPLQLVRLSDGWHALTENGWQFYSGSGAYQSAEEGRGTLIRMARAHAEHAELLSGPRCVVLAPDGSGQWRLWQLVRERLSLRGRLEGFLGVRDASAVARTLLDTAQRLLELDSRLQVVGDSPLHATLDTTGVFSGATQYVGLMQVRTGQRVQERTSLAQELQPLLPDWAPITDQLIAELGSEMSAGAQSRAGAQELIEMLRLMPR